MNGDPRFPRDGEGPRWFGLYPAVVSDLVDPDGKGRIKVRIPAFGAAGEAVFAWATLLTPYADKDQGLEILPEQFDKPFLLAATRTTGLGERGLYPHWTLGRHVVEDAAEVVHVLQPEGLVEVVLRAQLGHHTGAQWAVAAERGDRIPRQQEDHGMDQQRRPEEHRHHHRHPAREVDPHLRNRTSGLDDVLVVRQSVPRHHHLVDGR